MQLPTFPFASVIHYIMLLNSFFITTYTDQDVYDMQRVLDYCYKT